MNEAEWKKQFLLRLNAINGFKFINVPTAGRFNAGRGTADVVGSINGRICWIEFKSRTGTFSFFQKEFMDEWHRYAIRLGIRIDEPRRLYTVSLWGEREISAPLELLSSIQLETLLNDLLSMSDSKQHTNM